MDHLRICLNVVRGSSGFATALLFWRQLGNLLTHHRGRFFHLLQHYICVWCRVPLREFLRVNHETRSSLRLSWRDNNNKHFPGHKFWLSVKMFRFITQCEARRRKEIAQHQEWKRVRFFAREKYIVSVDNFAPCQSKMWRLLLWYALVTILFSDGHPIDWHIHPI